MCFAKEKLAILLRLHVEKESFKRLRLKLENVTFKSYFIKKKMLEERSANKEWKRG